MQKQTETKIRLPHNFIPRDYQLPVLGALDRGYKRVVWVAHRRSGKDKAFINYTAKAMYERVGGYYYIFPTYKQAKKVIWNGMDRGGYKFTDHFPQEIRKRTDNTDMLIETNNGSIFQLVGSDKIDSLMGANPIGCVFSEWPLQNPEAWDFLRPILAENDGWAAFIYTPRGKNHGYNTLETARAFPDIWYSEVLTVEDTKAIPEAVLAQERREIIIKDGNDALYQQEYMCNFDVPIQGAYYAKQLMLADDEGRIAGVPHDTAAEVHTAWDLGIDDAMSIWFFQAVGREIHFIDYFESSGEGISYYIKYLKEKPYVYGTHYAPHDIKVRELTTGRSRLETARSLGIRFEVVPRLDVEDGIEAVRNMLSRCWFDKTKCERGLSALRSYHKEWDEENQVFRLKPKHDWSCFTGDTKVLTRCGMYRIMDLPKMGEILTPWGWKKYTNPRQTGTNATLVVVKFKDGMIVRCTPEHLFLTESGWKSAESLERDTAILSSLTLLRSILMGGCIGFTQVRGILLEVVKNFIGRCGEMLSVLSQIIVTLTTKIETPKTINSTILSACQHKSIYQKHGMKRNIKDLLLKLEKKQKSGMPQKRGGCGTGDTLKESGVGQSGKGRNGVVRSVIKNLIVLYERMVTTKSIAQPTARLLRIDSVEKLTKKSNVWDITVPSLHLFSLENGAIVHNSHGSDSFRTFGVGFREKAKASGAVENRVEVDPYY